MGIKLPGNKVLLILMVVGVIGILLGGAYLAVVFGFPGIIRAAYNEKNCERTVWAVETYASLGGETSGKGAELVRMMAECNLFQQAGEQAGQKNWQAAYEGYKKYTQVFPGGVLASDSSEQGGAALFQLADQQLAAKNYSESIQSLKTLMTENAGSSASANGQTLLAKAYLTWGSDLRTTKDFAGAENMFTEMAVAAPDAATQAQKELYTTMLAWGGSLEAEKKLDEASKKYEQVLQLDPKSEAAGQASDALVNLYAGQGDALVAADNFEAGLSQYKTALKFANAGNEARAKDAMANDYLKWSMALNGKQDFSGAAEKISAAKEIAASDALKKSIADMGTELYLNFSKSDGEQAQKAMRQGMTDACAGKKPAIPIFGLDTTNVKLALFGMEAQLPDGMSAATPGAMHYVLCISERKKILESVSVRIIVVGFGSSLLSSSMTLITRTQYLWDVSLVDMVTGKEVAKKTFEGSIPENIKFSNGETIQINAYQGDHASRRDFSSKEGTKPVQAVVFGWMKTLLP